MSNSQHCISFNKHSIKVQEDIPTAYGKTKKEIDDETKKRESELTEEIIDKMFTIIFLTGTGRIRLHPRLVKNKFKIFRH